MPRVTKSQKEAGHPVKTKSKSKPYSTKDGNNRTGGQGERKKGFQVGPAHAPRDAYLGKGTLHPSHYPTSDAADPVSEY
jgi:hypothetical protein